MNLYNFSVWSFGIASFLLGLMVFLKRRDGLGRAYFFTSVSVSVWGLAHGISLSETPSYDLALLTARIANGDAFFIATFWFHFILLLTKNNERFRSFLRLLYAISILFIPLTFCSWFIPLVRSMAGIKFYIYAGPIYHILPAVFLVVVFLSFFLLLKQFQNSQDKEKKQLGGFLIFAGFGFLGGSLTFFPAYNIPFPQYGLLLLLVYPFGTAYYMIREKLFDIEELAQAAHRDKLMAIGVLTASINHEVRNPLYVIHGLAEGYLEKQKENLFLGDKEIVERSNEIMKKTMEQSERAMDIIKRLSMFAKSGIEQDIRIVPVCIQEVVEDVLSLLNHEINANGIRFEPSIPGDLPKVYADKGFLEEIVFNLLVNASQAIKTGGQPGMIRFEATVVGSMLVLTISDSGPGIPRDKLDRIFQPFYTTKDEGTGLGLYITKQLVDRIGAHITAESEEGKGACFTLECKVFAVS